MTPPGHQAAPAHHPVSPIDLAARAMGDGRLDEAEKHCRKAISAGESAAVARQLLGLIAHRRGDYASAVTFLRESIRQAPAQAVWHFNLGVSCRAAGRLDEAEAAYRRAVELDPAYAPAHYNLGSVLHDKGDPKHARGCYEKTLGLDPTHGNACYRLAGIHRDNGNIGRALNLMRRAVGLIPDDVEIRLALGVALLESGAFEEARETMLDMLRDYPGRADVTAVLAGACERLGMRDEAWALIEPLLGRESVSVDVLLVLADLAPKIGRVRDAIDRLARVIDSGDLEDSQWMLVHFALGRLHDGERRYDRAFDHFARANALKPRHYDPEEHELKVNAIIRAFDADALSRRPRAARRDDRPVLIVGMPRSGTSLVEQILASHPDVAGGGELPDLMNLSRQAWRIAERDASGLPITSLLTQQHYDEMAQIYLARLDKVSVDTLRITDKTPNNFLNLGLAALMLPGVRVIHCQRDAMASCWSCYTQNFVGEHAYSYDLAHLGHYHRQYQRLMDHWRVVLDVPLFEVAYESLVADPGPVMRGLVAFCGLPWSDACERFYESRRAMPSASYVQVRRPIYTGSVDRWRHYEGRLGPLRDALGGPGA